MASSSSAINFNGRVFCLVTGASRGIGRALAIQISQQMGPNSVLLLLARTTDELIKTVDLCRKDNIEVVSLPIDLGKTPLEDFEVDLFLQSHLPNAQSFDYAMVVHNVGSIGDLTIETCKMDNSEDMRRYYDLNVFNIISMNTKFLKFFQDFDEKVIIVNITSLCAIKPMGGMAYYCSGKAAREMYFKVLAEEKPQMRILNYSPGPVRTDMIDYVIDNTVNENLKEVFTSFKNQGTLLQPEVTAAKCLKVLFEGKFQNGDHVDYFDDD